MGHPISENLKNVASKQEERKIIPQKFGGKTENAYLCAFLLLKHVLKNMNTLNSRDSLVVMEGAEMKGRAAGRAEGLAEGEQIKALKIARKLKAKGMAVEEVAELTGLSEEEVAGL